MELNSEIETWANYSQEEKKRNLFFNQKNLLDTFLSHGTISREQYKKSLDDLSDKMGFKLQEL